MVQILDIFLTVLNFLHASLPFFHSNIQSKPHIHLSIFILVPSTFTSCSTFVDHAQVSRIRQLLTHWCTDFTFQLMVTTGNFSCTADPSSTFLLNLP